MSNPLVSIIIPCYKQEEFLNECLQSVLSQTYDNWECLVINDGGENKAMEIVEQWKKKDSRFKYFYKENGGVASARNFAINKANGTWILPLDADDKIDKNYLKLASLHFEDSDLIYCLANKFGSTNEFWQLPEYSLNRLAISNMIFCSALFKKEHWEKINGYDEKLIWGLEDWEFWLSLLKKGDKKVIRLPQILFYYRIKSQSRNTDAVQKHNLDNARHYIYSKHSDFYMETFGNYHFILKSYLNYKERYEKIINSKKYKLINRIFSLINR